MMHKYLENCFINKQLTCSIAFFAASGVS